MHEKAGAEGKVKETATPAFRIAREPPNADIPPHRSGEGCGLILIDGTQYADGSLERLTVHGVDDDKHVPTDTARKIAAALIEAADEIDSLT